MTQCIFGWAVMGFVIGLGMVAAWLVGDNDE